MSDNIHHKCREIMAELGKKGEFIFWDEFVWPDVVPLTRKLKDVLEDDVDEKYYLSDKMIDGFVKKNEHQGYINQDTQGSAVFSAEKTAPTLCAFTHGYSQGYIKIEGTLDIKGNDQIRRVYDTKVISPTLTTMEGENRQPKIVASRGRNKDNPSDRTVGNKVEQRFEVNENGTSNALTTVQKDNYVLLPSFSIRKLTPLECWRLQDFPDDAFRKAKGEYKHKNYYQLVYGNINKKEIKWNVRLKAVKEKQKQLNTETYVLCTTRDLKDMEKIFQLKISEQKNALKEKTQSVSIVIEKLGGLELKGCATNTIKWTGCTKTLFTEIKKLEGQGQGVMFVILTEKDSIEPSWRITLEENSIAKKLFTTLILTKLIIESKIYTYVKTQASIHISMQDLEKLQSNYWKIGLSYLRMETTKQKVSDTMLYKQAGNSMSVNVLEMIFGQIEKAKNKETGGLF